MTAPSTAQDGGRRTARMMELARSLIMVSQDAIDRITRIVGSLRNCARLDRSEIEHGDLHAGICTRGSTAR